MQPPIMLLNNKTGQIAWVNLTPLWFWDQQPLELWGGYVYW